MGNLILGGGRNGVWWWWWGRGWIVGGPWRCDVAIGPVSFLSRDSAPFSLSPSAISGREGGETSCAPSSEPRRAPPVNDAHQLIPLRLALRMPFALHVSVWMRSPLSSPSYFCFFHPIPVVIAVCAGLTLPSSPPPVLDPPPFHPRSWRSPRSLQKRLATGSVYFLSPPTTSSVCVSE